jgi:hypothetical protein
MTRFQKMANFKSFKNLLQGEKREIAIGLIIVYTVTTYWVISISFIPK